MRRQTNRQTDTCPRLVKSQDPQGKGGNSCRAANTPCKQNCHITDRKNRLEEEERGVKAAGSKPGGRHGFGHPIQTRELSLRLPFASLSRGKQAVTPAASGGMGRMGRTPMGELAQG